MKHRYPQGRRRRTHCKRGHEYTEANTRWKKQTGRAPTRACIECQRNHQRKQNAQFTGLGGANGTGVGGPRRTGRGRELQRAGELRRAQELWWASVLARPDDDKYKRAMLESVALMAEYDHDRARRQQRGVLGNQPGFRREERAA